MKTRVHVWFTGRVQGVGFRNRTAVLARESGLTGWVRNLPDGRVEMVAEGATSTVEALLAALDARFEISHKEIRESPFEGEFPDFGVLR